MDGKHQAKPPQDHLAYSKCEWVELKSDSPRLYRKFNELIGDIDEVLGEHPGVLGEISTRQELIQDTFIDQINRVLRNSDAPIALTSWALENDLSGGGRAFFPSTAKLEDSKVYD